MNADCDGKKQYRTWAEARSGARHLHRVKGATASPYRCGRCPYYHVGNGFGDAHLSARLRRTKLNRIREKEAWL